jgi:hypothetical protein
MCTVVILGPRDVVSCRVRDKYSTFLPSDAIWNVQVFPAGTKSDSNHATAETSRDVSARKDPRELKCEMSKQGTDRRYRVVRTIATNTEADGGGRGVENTEPGCMV